MKIKDPKEYALYLLKFKDRSERNIEEKMSQKDFSPDEIRETISFLLEKEFIDEPRLAKSIIRDGLEFKLWGEIPHPAKTSQGTSQKRDNRE